MLCHRPTSSFNKIVALYCELENVFDIFFFIYSHAIRDLIFTTYLIRPFFLFNVPNTRFHLRVQWVIVARFSIIINSQRLPEMHFCKAVLNCHIHYPR